MPSLDLEKIKAAGLQVDLEKYAREGYRSITNPEDLYRLKMHGICMQRHEGFFMFRMRVSGGRLNPAKMRCIAELAAECGSRMVHLTTRQNVELHNVRIEHAPTIIRRLNEVGIFPRSACGHTFRNVLGDACAGLCPGEILDVRPWVALVSNLIVAKKDAYNQRLPKRLNVSFHGCTPCASPSLVNDLGFDAVLGPAGEKGFRFSVGGSIGLTARLGTALRDFLPLADVVPALKAVTELYIAHTDRKNPAKTRLKFLLEAWGVEKFRTEFEKLLPSMRAPDPDLPQGFLPVPWVEEKPAGGVEMAELPRGVLAQRQKGFYRVPLLVQLGEIHFSHFRELADWAGNYAQGRVLITKEQNLEVQWVPGNKVQELLALAANLGCPAGDAKSVVDVQACPGTSFCTLAVTSSQGAAHSLIDYFNQHKVLADEGLRDLRVHINGCANSCAQHQGADIGIFGGQMKVGDDTRYAWSMYLGGSLEPEVVIGALSKKTISDEMLVPVVDALFTVFRRDREKAEAFRPFLKRLTPAEVVKRLDQVLQDKGMSPNTYNRVVVEPWQVWPGLPAPVPGG
jgi:sulfite reductase beta subunit-like hemoprotein